MKFGLWLLIAVVAVLWFNHAKRQRLKQRPPPPAATTGHPPAAEHPAENQAGELIVACAYCGLHVPRSDAVVGPDGAAVYCSESHRRLHSHG